MKKRNHNRNQKSEQNSVLTDTQGLLSKEELIEIQAEAYYRAMKRIEEERQRENDDYVQKKIGALETIKLLFYLVFMPKKVVEKSKKGKIAFGLLSFMSTVILFIIGLIMQFVALGGTIFFCYSFFVERSILIFELLNYVPYLLLLGLIGGMFRAAAKDIEMTQDKEFVFQYVASITGILAFLVAMIALLK